MLFFFLIIFYCYFRYCVYLLTHDALNEVVWKLIGSCCCVCVATPQLSGWGLQNRLALNFAVNHGLPTHFKPHMNPKRRAQGIRAHLQLAFSVYKCSLRKGCGLRSSEREWERDQGQSIFIPEQFLVPRRSSTFPKIRFLLKWWCWDWLHFCGFLPICFSCRRDGNNVFGMKMAGISCINTYFTNKRFITPFRQKIVKWNTDACRL